MLTIGLLGLVLAVFTFWIGLVLGRTTPSQPDWERRRQQFRIINGEDEP